MEAGKHLNRSHPITAPPFYAPFHKALREEEKLSPSFPLAFILFAKLWQATDLHPINYLRFHLHIGIGKSIPWLKSDQLHISKCLFNLLIMSGYTQPESQRTRECTVC